MPWQGREFTAPPPIRQRLLPPENGKFFGFFSSAILTPCYVSPLSGEGIANCSIAMIDTNAKANPPGAPVLSTALSTARPVSPSQTPEKTNKTRDSKLKSMTMLLILLAPAAGLGVARTLEPDPRGLGTHQQLGLPPCSVRILFGIPGPSCGMTTSWAFFSRGEFQQSLSTNLGGFLLACLAVLMALLAAFSRLMTQPSKLPLIPVFCLTLLGIFGLSVIQWLWRHVL